MTYLMLLLRVRFQIMSYSQLMNNNLISMSMALSLLGTHPVRFNCAVMPSNLLDQYKNEPTYMEITESVHGRPGKKHTIIISVYINGRGL